MNIFVVFKVSDSTKLERAIEDVYPEDHLKLQDDEWLISGGSTAQEVSDRLGVSSGDNGSAMIFRMGSYYGRASTNIWDWIKTKSEDASD
jgi:hypothetical protein